MKPAQAAFLFLSLCVLLENHNAAVKELFIFQQTHTILFPYLERAFNEISLTLSSCLSQ